MEEIKMSSEVSITFKTNMPEVYQVPEIQIQLKTNSTNKELTNVERVLFNRIDS